MPYCSICKQNYTSRYCPDCGQVKSTSRLTVLSLLNDIFSSFFSLEKSLFSNLVTLFKRPGFIINNYLDGYRNYHYSPFKLTIITSLCIAILFLITDSRFFVLNISESSVQDQFLLLFFFVFLLSFTSHIVYYWQWKKSYLEHLIINLYSIGFWTIVFVPLALIDNLFLDSQWLSWGLTAVYFLLIIIWNSRVFDIQRPRVRFVYIVLNILVLLAVIFAHLKISMII